ncbi:hypothetical protein H0H81_010428 [Sphagnurus paluster]|uniref:Uncharacterized protein n=1 Tax=Sphagnurus paluster TaxID=117069 RepID=A0A9P7GPA1_9AGAR|nr:hypothetical protein H0H81_010428 [Sphagnurus paluster]
MELPPCKLETVEEEGWHIVTDDWWHTLFESVSWTFNPENTTGKAMDRPAFLGSLLDQFGASCSFVAFSGRRHNAPDSPRDLALSPDLPGVRCTMTVVAAYEADVGILSGNPEDSQRLKEGKPVDISIPRNEGEVTRGKEMWNVYAEHLTTGILPEASDEIPDSQFVSGTAASRVSSPSSSLHRSTSTLSSVDLTDSDVSFNSISQPSTPKGRSAEAVIQVNDGSPTKRSMGHYISPSRPLNASASSFVPSRTPAKAKNDTFSFSTPTAANPQPAFANFTFPSMETTPVPTVRIKKDEHGFYSEAEVAAPVPQSQGAGYPFLPPFLQDSPRRRAPVSKTRAMVDRLRSSHNHSHSPVPNPPLYDTSIFDERISVSEDDRARDSGISSPSSQEEDDDGWINLTESDKTSQESKARRTRNLFLALTRRRSDSVSPNQNAEANADEHLGIEVPFSTSPEPSKSLLPVTDDGWIEGPSTAPPKNVTLQPRRTEPRTRPHRKRRSSQALPTANNPTHFIPATTLRTPVGLGHTPFHLTTSHFPQSYFYAAYPSVVSPAAYTSYVQQLQLMQMQMQNGGRGIVAPPSAEWFQYATSSAKAFATANGSTSVVSQAPLGRRESLW